MASAVSVREFEDWLRSQRTLSRALHRSGHRPALDAPYQRRRTRALPRQGNGFRRSM